MTAHFLMVDDEPDAQDLFRQHFRREIRKGVFSFDFALSGEEALATLAERNPVAVLSDINMPGMSGIDLLAEIHAARPDLPVLMITAYGDKATETRVKALGALALMPKPVDFGSLKTTLARFSESG